MVFTTVGSRFSRLGGGGRVHGFHGRLVHGFHGDFSAALLHSTTKDCSRSRNARLIHGRRVQGLHEFTGVHADRGLMFAETGDWQGIGT